MISTPPSFSGRCQRWTHRLRVSGAFQSVGNPGCSANRTAAPSRVPAADRHQQLGQLRLDPARRTRRG